MGEEITLDEVLTVEKATSFSEPPPYAVLTVSKWGGRARGNFTVHASLRAVKTHISACSKDWQNARSYGGRKTRKEDFISQAHFRVYEYHGSDGWIPIYDVPFGQRFQLEHELWQAKAPTQKVAAPEDDIAAAIASIVGVGGQQETWCEPGQPHNPSGCDCGESG